MGATLIVVCGGILGFGVLLLLGVAVRDAFANPEDQMAEIDREESRFFLGSLVVFLLVLGLIGGLAKALT